MCTSETNCLSLSLAIPLSTSFCNSDSVSFVGLPGVSSLSYIYSNVRVETNADDTVRSTFCVSVTRFKINDVLLYMHLFA